MWCLSRLRLSLPPYLLPQKLPARQAPQVLILQPLVILLLQIQSHGQGERETDAIETVGGQKVQYLGGLRGGGREGGNENQSRVTSLGSFLPYPPSLSPHLELPEAVGVAGVGLAPEPIDTYGVCVMVG